MSSSSPSSFDPSLPLQERSSVLPGGERLESILSAGGDSQLVPCMSSQSSSSVTCTMRDYEDQLSSFKRENLNLKLRIYMMENAVGFHGNDEKNVLKLNVDLRVENEELKKELSDRKDLLGQAYSTLSNFEEVYKSTECRVESLEKENEHLRETNRKLLCTAKRLTKGGAELDVGVDILEDAFGTLSEDDGPFFLDKGEDFQKNLLQLILGEDADIPASQNEILDAVRLRLQETVWDTQDGTLTEIKKWVKCTHQYLTGESMPESLRFDLFDDPALSVKSALKKLSELADAFKIKDQLLYRLEDELEQSKKICDDLEANANILRDSSQEIQKRFDLKSNEMDSMTKELETKSEKLTKSYEFCQSLTKALAEQKSLVEKFKKDLKVRDGMIKKLTDEYNDLKAKVRARSDYQHSHKSEPDVVKNMDNTGQSTSSNVNEVIGALSLGTCEEIRSSIKTFRNECIRKGCVAAMQCYQRRIKSVQKDVSSAVNLMRGRLQELAEFLQRLLDSNEGTEEQRRISKDFLENLHTNLSETRRLSASLINESSILSESLQFGENVMDEIEEAFTVKDDSVETLLKEVDDLKSDLSSEDMQFFEDIEKEVVERVLTSSSISTCSSEVQELKCSLEEERLLIEKMSQIQLELKKQLDVIKDESELKSEEIKRVYNELNVKSSRIEAVEEEINTLSCRIEEYKDREGSIKSCFMGEVKSLKSQLSETVASKEELEQDLKSLQEEKKKIIQCCSENENLKEELRTVKEELNSLNDMLCKDKAKRAEIERQMTKQLLKTRKVLKQTRQIGSEDSTDKEN